MEARRRNENIREKHEKGKRILLPLSMIFILLFWSIFGRLDSTVEVMIFLVGLVLTIYLFYTGLSAWTICYIRKKGNAVYRGQNLFLLRQFASKVKTMQFTMGTLTSLFTLALLGASIALMFSEYENTMLDGKFPFDVLAYSSDTNDDFSDEIAVINAETASADYYPYHIYTDYSNQVNTWMLTHLEAWGTMYQKTDGSPDTDKIKEMLLNGCMFGALVEGRMAGFIGTHIEGSIGMLEVYEEYRRRGIAESLESYIINTRLSKGLLPYGDIIVGNEPSFGLQRKLGLKITKENFYWVVAFSLHLW